MSKRALLPGEREAWERACAEKRWVVRTPGGFWAAVDGRWAMFAAQAEAGTRAYISEMRAFPVDTVAYRARSVRADGTPVVP